jgi:hypothetical protein
MWQKYCGAAKDRLLLFGGKYSLITEILEILNGFLESKMQSEYLLQLICCTVFGQ